MLSAPSELCDADGVFSGIQSQWVPEVLCQYMKLAGNIYSEQGTQQALPPTPTPLFHTHTHSQVQHTHMHLK